MPYILKPGWFGPTHYNQTVKKLECRIDCYPTTYVIDLGGTDEYMKDYIPNHYNTTFKFKFR